MIHVYCEIKHQYTLLTLRDTDVFVLKAFHLFHLLRL